MGLRCFRPAEVNVLTLTLTLTLALALRLTLTRTSEVGCSRIAEVSSLTRVGEVYLGVIGFFVSRSRSSRSRGLGLGLELGLGLG